MVESLRVGSDESGRTGVAVARDVSGDAAESFLPSLRVFAPELSRITGDGGARRIVRLGAARAAQYGLTGSAVVRFYLEVMLSLGSDFDTDPQLPWARRILTDPSPGDSATRARRLHDAVRDYLNRVVGPENEHLLAALERVRRTGPQQLRQLSGPFEEALLEKLRVMHPQKCNVVGEAALRELVCLARQQATPFDVSTPHGVATVTALMFAFGHGVAADPAYPWVAATLTDARFSHPQARADRLYRRMCTYWQQMLKHLT